MKCGIFPTSKAGFRTQKSRYSKIVHGTWGPAAVVNCAICSASIIGECFIFRGPKLQGRNPSREKPDFATKCA